jgi:hypothetical protein
MNAQALPTFFVSFMLILRNMDVVAKGGSRLARLRSSYLREVTAAQL